MKFSRPQSTLFAMLSFASAVCFVQTASADIATIACGQSYCIYDSATYGNPQLAQQAFIAGLGSNPYGQENFGNQAPGTPNTVGLLYPGNPGAVDTLTVVAGGPVGGGIDVASNDIGLAFGGQYYYGYSYADTSKNAEVVIAPGLLSTPTGSVATSGFFGIISNTPLNASEDGIQIYSNGTTIYLDDVLYASAPGISAANPFYPDSTCDPGWTASMCTGPVNGRGGGNSGGGGCSIDGVKCYVWGLGALGLAWLDPTTANEYVYQDLNGSLFTSIAGFPSGFSAPFDVSSGGVNYGLFEPGQTLVFRNGGVSSFTISGIDPSVDGTDPTAFPLEVRMSQIGAMVEATAYNQPTVTPEPSYLLCVAGGLAGLVCLGRRRRNA